MATKNPTALDLFAGAGGLGLGFSRAGFDVKWAVESSYYAAQNYKSNLPDTIVLNQTVEQSFDFLSTHQFDVIFGGPPCQGFSLTGLRDPLDPRNDMWRWFFKFVQTINPKIFVMENVPAIISMTHIKDNLGKDSLDIILAILKQMQQLKEIQVLRRSKKDDVNLLNQYNFLKISQKTNTRLLNKWMTHLLPDIVRCANESGYETKFKVLHAEEFGTPQYRDRFFMVGCRSDLDLRYAFPGLPEVLRPSGRSAEVVLRDLEGKVNDGIPNHIMAATSPSVLQRIKETLPGHSIYGFNASGYRIFPNEPTPTVTGNHGSVFIHYKEDRYLTLRELARLQDFPDNYVFYGPKAEIYKQLGNAVPVRLAEAVAISIRDTLEGKNIPYLDKLVLTKNDKR